MSYILHISVSFLYFAVKSFKTVYAWLHCGYVDIVINVKIVSIGIHSYGVAIIKLDHV